MKEINDLGYAYSPRAHPHNDEAVIKYYMEQQPGRGVCTNPYPNQLNRYKQLLYDDVKTDLLMRHDGY